MWAPPGTHFHQFVVPPIFSFRRDCTYGKLAAMRLPDDVEGLGHCEVAYVNTHFCTMDTTYLQSSSPMSDTGKVDAIYKGIWS